MFKLTFALAAALYAGFVIWGQPTDIVSEDQSGLVTLSADAAEYDRPVILNTDVADQPQVTRAEANTGPIVDAAAIAASAPDPAESFPQPRLIGEPLVVSLVQPGVEPAAGTDAEGGDLLRVTGTRVNMRAGPSTANRVIDSLPAGTLAEPLGAPVEGWQQIRDVATGRTGYMAARFLEPA